MTDYPWLFLIGGLTQQQLATEYLFRRKREEIDRSRWWEWPMDRLGVDGDEADEA